MERLISDPTNTTYWRWVSEVKNVTISSVPTAPTFTSATGAGVGEITLNRTVKANGSGRAVTADKYRLNGGAWVLVPGDLEIGARTITGLTAGASYQIDVVAENANGQGAILSLPAVTAGTAIVAPTTTTLTFGLQQVVVQGTQTVVTHVDGPKCIVSASPVIVNGKTPATIYTAGAVRNGCMKNPVTRAQAFDSRATQLYQNLVVTFPVTLNPGDILLMAVSKDETVTDWINANLGQQRDREGVVDEYDMIYVAASAPDPDSLAPAAIGWTGRGTTLTAGPVVDYLAKAALLPTTYDNATWPYGSEVNVEKAVRFNPAFALTDQPNSAPGSTALPVASAGYERVFPWRWGFVPPITATAALTNYGAYLDNRISDVCWYLFAPLNKVSLATKAKILMRIHSFAWQTEASWTGNNWVNSRGANGGHYLIHQGPFAIGYWLTGNETGLDTLRTKFAGNWNQYFRLTEEMVPEWFEPWGDENDPTAADMNTTYKPHFSRKRKISAVDAVAKTITIPSWTTNTETNDGQTAFGQSTKNRWGGLYVTLASNPAITARVVTDEVVREDDWAGTTKTLTLQDWPGFAVNDVIYARSPGVHNIGDAEWRLSPTLNRYNPSKTMSYRQEARPLNHLAFLRILGVHRDDWQEIWDYCMRTVEPNVPAVEMDYEPAMGTSNLGWRLWQSYSEVIKTIPQPALSAVDPTPFYPDVPDVNLMIEGGALKFPEGNFNEGNDDSGLKIYKGALYQNDTNVPGALATTSHQAWFAIVRLPLDKHENAKGSGIIGNSGTGTNRTYLTYYGKAVGNGAYRDRFVTYQIGGSGTAVNIFSAPWTKDTALVVVKCTADNNWVCDWYELGTGTKFAGTPVAATHTASGGLSGTTFGIGANITDTTAFATNKSLASYTMFPGEMEAVGIVHANISDATWQSIAQGADIVTALGAANIPYLKKWDATSAALVKPAAATSDTSANPVPLGAGADPVAVPASRLLPGSTIRRQSQSTYLTIDLLSEGWVYGLTAGQTTRLVPFAGTAAGYTGNVEVRVYDAMTGDVVRDWTVAGAISGGVWSGNIELPKGNGWWFAEARVANTPTVKAYRRTEFSVGYKILLLGQSQLLIMQGVTAQVNHPPVALTHPQSFSYLTAGLVPASYSIRMSRVGTSATRTASYGPLYGMHWFANQFRKFDPTTPFMIVDDTATGTGFADLCNDAQPALRSWQMLQGKLDAFGTDITLIVHQWATNDANTSGTAGTTNTTVYKERLDALFKGTGAAATWAHYLSDVIPGAEIVMSPTSRYIQLNTPIAFQDPYYQHERTRTQVCEWAYANGKKVGPPLSDVRVEDGTAGPGATHTSGEGSKTGIVRIAVAAARGLGLDVSTNPYFTTAAFNPGRTTIAVSVALPNGGTLYCPTPTAVRSFEVQDGGVGNWLPDSVASPGTGTFTAAVVGNTVVLTKNSGTWAVGTKVRYLSGLQDRRGGDGASEDAIVAAALYETWALDVLGKGLPLLGSLVSGNWYPDWSVTVT
jgi:hypothetical protein